MPVISFSLLLRLCFLRFMPLGVLCLPCAAQSAVPRDMAGSIQQLTFEGQNRQPLLHGSEGFFFVSRSRTAHKDSQIYYKEYASDQEYRVTHQRGHIIGGQWQAGGRLFYASTTDEDKETPEVLKEYLEKFPVSIDPQFFFHIQFGNTELYSSSLHGEDIRRLSHHPGFDGFPAFVGNDNKLFFSRLVDQKINIYAKKHSAKTTNALRNRRPSSRALRKPVLQTGGHDLGLQISPSKDQFVWYRFSPDFKSSQLMIADQELKEPRLLTVDTGIQWTPSWHPNGKTVLFSAKKRADKNYNLYELTVASGCQRKITSIPGDEFYPVVSSDGDTILFTATTTGKEQIHSMAYPRPFACEDGID